VIAVSFKCGPVYCNYNYYNIYSGDENIMYFIAKVFKFEGQMRLAAAHGGALK